MIFCRKFSKKEIALKNLQTADTAILVFARSAAKEQQIKQFRHSKELFAALNADILRKVKATRLPYFLYDEHLQLGSKFGTRITTAIQTVFSKGYENVIVLGNDTPQLTVATILQSQVNLQQGKTVIGPAADGGIYLLGIHRSKFDALELQGLPWQKSSLFEKLAISFMRKGVLHQLPQLHDLDVFEDIKRIVMAEGPLTLGVAKILWRMLKVESQKTTHTPNTTSTFYSTSQYNKGSPFLHF